MTDEYMRVFRAFTDKNRIQILELLCGGEQCACVLLEDLKISQPTLSHHMKILCNSGIVTCRRVGPWNYYSINTDGCNYASRLLELVARKKLGTTVKIMAFLYRPLYLCKGRHKEHKKAASVCCCEAARQKDCSGTITGGILK